MNFWKDQKGFTFLEMSIVVAIIGIIMLMAMPNYQGAAAKAQAKSCEANRKLIEAQVINYMMDKASEPTNVEALWTAGYLKDKPKCPVKGEGAYTFEIVPADNISLQKINVFCSEHAKDPDA
ncbi:competence type IV pilus major pilin ComGC [Ammoniphilus sp. 3BR4]|uniref:competence type IV pilus major pilin ComGC n=1 Tax=Ammoniphilus sp. 3BR4 TaxID=3158265 RepID=UPI0034659297